MHDCERYLRIYLRNVVRRGETMALGAFAKVLVTESL